MNDLVLRSERRLSLAPVVICMLSMSAFAVDVQAAQEARTPAATTPAGKPPGAPTVVDVYEQHKDEYVSPKTPTLVDIGEAHYLAITGKGEPGGPAFRRKVGAMYQAAFAVKMRSKFAGRDYSVAPLEGLWWGSKKEHGFLDEPRETWNWKLLIRVPEFITSKDVSNAVDAGAGQGGDALNEVHLETLTEGRCVQVLYVGPYDREADTISAMRDFARKKRLTLNGPHHEIYLSDPNRTEPAKLLTILRQPVKTLSE